MLKREEHDSAFCFHLAIKRQQILRWLFNFDGLWRRMRLHSSHLRLPLIPR